MYKLNGMRLMSECCVFDYFTNNLELVFDIENGDTWDKSFNIGLDENGNIVKCSSLVSTMDNIDYYIEMGKILETIKGFCGIYGKMIYDRIKKVVEDEDKELEELYEKEKNTESEIKRTRGYDKLLIEEKDLFNKITNLRKKRRRLRKENKIMEISIEIEVLEKNLEDLRNKIDLIKVELDSLKKYTEKERMQIKECSKVYFNTAMELYNAYLLAE